MADWRGCNQLSGRDEARDGTVGVLSPRLASIPRMARFICASAKWSGWTPVRRLRYRRVLRRALHKGFALNEHAARPTARVVHPSFGGRKHLHQHPHYAAGRVELAASLAFRAGKL